MRGEIAATRDGKILGVFGARAGRNAAAFVKENPTASAGVTCHGSEAAEARVRAGRYPAIDPVPESFGPEGTKPGTASN